LGGGETLNRVTLDTSALPADELVEPARERGFELGRVSVTDREVEGTQFEVRIEGVSQVLESAVVGESRSGQAVWSSRESPFEEILQIIVGAAFPAERSNLSRTKRHDLRDAMILEAHVRERRHTFVTNDVDAFIRSGRRERLESRFGIRILTRDEFAALIGL
jgi:hypothetical protein